jgi:phosphatidylglycerol:prolipoprotein diacylglycerol transferase
VSGTLGAQMGCTQEGPPASSTERNGKLHPVLLHIGPILIRSYPALIDIGLLIGVTWAILEARRCGLDAMPVLDAGLAAAVGGLILARAAYVGVHWSYYSRHVHQALGLQDGGLAWQGALVGGTAGATGLCTLRNPSVLATLDRLTRAAASVAISAWLGCFLCGCACGAEIFPGQGLLWTLSLDLPDLYGIREPRGAVQWLGTGWSALALGAILIAERHAQRRGSIFVLWLTLYSLGFFVLGFLRGDEIALIAGRRADQVADLALGIAGVGAMLLGSLICGRGSGVHFRRPETEVML